MNDKVYRKETRPDRVLVVKLSETEKAVVDSVMKQKGHSSYAEALHYLARKYNIEIVEKEESAEDIAQRQRRESLLLVSEFARKFYTEQLESGEGLNVGYAYYKSRGITDETIKKFGLGWAPSGRTALADAAVAAGYKMEYVLAAGLAVEREDGSIADKFRERVMFPVHSVSGRVVAFSGRTLHSDNPAKYVNSPETEIYVKSRNLLGIYFAKSEISRLDKCILVEGNVDMVMMHQLGICNVVASCGTSLTVEQIRLIHKFTENVTIMYDGDSAGIHAALRGTDLILSEGLNVKIVLLPDGEDPDSFSRKHSLNEINSFIESNEKDFIAFKTDLLLADAAGDPLKKANLINDIADTIAVIPDAVKRSVYVDYTSRKFGTESSILFDRVGATRRGTRTPAGTETSGTEETDVQVTLENSTVASAEIELLKFLLKNGRDTLDFESDSEYYSGDEAEKPTVTDFIRSALEADGSRMLNSAYAKVYDAYMEQYDSGVGQDDIVRHLLDSSDRVVAKVVGELSIDKYRITVQAFENALTAKSSWLVSNVPWIIMVYNERRIQVKVDSLRRALSEASESEQLGILQEMKKFQNAQLRIKQIIGKEKN